VTLTLNTARSRRSGTSWTVSAEWMRYPERIGNDFAMEKGRRRPSGFAVPGGYVTTKVRGGMSFIVSLPRNILQFSARGFEQDIVILDTSRTRQLYREGPYNNISVQRPLQRTLADIEKVGLDEFLRSKQIENSQIGPVKASNGRQTLPVLAYIRTRMGVLIHRRGPK
jgi:hypothetical protein